MKTSLRVIGALLILIPAASIFLKYQAGTPGALVEIGAVVVGVILLAAVGSLERGHFGK